MIFFIDWTEIIVLCQIIIVISSISYIFKNTGLPILNSFITFKIIRSKFVFFNGLCISQNFNSVNRFCNVYEACKACLMNSIFVFLCCFLSKVKVFGICFVYWRWGKLHFLSWSFWVFSLASISFISYSVTDQMVLFTTRFSSVSMHCWCGAFIKLVKVFILFFMLFYFDFVFHLQVFSFTFSSFFYTCFSFSFGCFIIFVDI